MRTEDVAIMKSFVGQLRILENYTQRCDCSLHRGAVVISVAVLLPNGRPAIVQEEDDGFLVEVGNPRMIGRGDLRDQIPVPYERLNVDDAVTYLTLAGL